VDRLALVADCGSCFGLCCVALAFERSADFPVDKDAGDSCQHLDGGFGCSIHAELRSEGYRGCTVYDCFGAGQQVSQVTFGAVSWHEAPETSGAMFAALPVMRQLHEMLWYLVEAAERTTASEHDERMKELCGDIRQTLDGDASSVLAFDVERLRADVRHLLIEVSEEVRGGYASQDVARDLHPSADLVGRDLRSRRLCGADLRGAYLIAADLRHADLTSVDLLGADLRDARLDGADLSKALFLTQMQVDAAQGDGSTALPNFLRRPQHWPG
jgi:uncharacterized protein YjbI with pentapeptide repeats